MSNYQYSTGAPFVTKNVSARCWSSRDSREPRELQGLGHCLGSCNVSSQSRLRQNFERLGLGSKGLVHIPAVMCCVNYHVKLAVSSSVITSCKHNI